MACGHWKLKQPQKRGAFGTNRKVWRRAVLWKTRLRYYWRFSWAVVEGTDELWSRILQLPKALRHELNFKEKLLVLLYFGPKNKKDSPSQNIIWSTWSNRLFLCQSILLHILTLPPYASADQSSTFPSLSRNGFPAPHRRAGGSKEINWVTHSCWEVWEDGCLAWSQPVSCCTVTNGSCQTASFITGRLQGAAASSPVWLCGRSSTCAVTLIDDHHSDSAQRYTCRQGFWKEIEQRTAQPLV